MVGHLCAIHQFKQAAAQTIAPRWGWGRKGTLNYKHCVPTGLKPARGFFLTITLTCRKQEQ